MNIGKDKPSNPEKRGNVPEHLVLFFFLILTSDHLMGLMICHD